MGLGVIGNEHPGASKESNRLQFIDAAKTLAIYIVLFYHVGPGIKDLVLSATDNASYLKYLCFGLPAIGVPLFFAVNGYLLLNRPLDFRKHVFKTLRLYFLTLIWSLITVGALIGIDGDRYSISEFFRAVVYLKMGVNNHLWFLFALVSLYLLLPAIKPIYDYPDEKPILWLLWLFFIFSLETFFGTGVSIHYCIASDITLRWWTPE